MADIKSIRVEAGMTTQTEPYHTVRAAVAFEVEVGDGDSPREVMTELHELAKRQLTLALVSAADVENKFTDLVKGKSREFAELVEDARKFNENSEGGEGSSEGDGVISW